MPSTRADRHLRTMRLAKDCSDLGARSRTIHHVTGMQPRELRRLLVPDPQTSPRGRAPDSPDWYHSANLLYRAESSIFMSIYRKLRNNGFEAGETLVGAYRHYQSVCQCPHRISFDRAFDLASHTDGIWLAKSSAFSVIVCPVCSCEFLAAAGTVAPDNHQCPFCRLVQRYATDQRVQSSFPQQALCDPLSIQLHVMALGRPTHTQSRPADGDRPSQ